LLYFLLLSCRSRDHRYLHAFPTRRSSDLVVDLAIEDHADGFVLVPDRLPAALQIDDAQPPHAEREARREVGPRAIRPAVHDEIEDRKSTRLNSSHVKISYAVFCLKKKTTA